MALITMTHVGYAASLPGPADASRIEQREGLQPPEPNLLSPATPPESPPPNAAPEPSKHMLVTLHDVVVEGMSVFTKADIKDIYAPFLDHEISLDKVWQIAGEIADRYHNAGYFLSQVLVPQQEIKDGSIVLHVVEGYIGEVKLDTPLADNRIVKQWIDRLLASQPIKADQIESVLLHLNDLPGVNLQSVLEPMQQTLENPEGAVRLVLEPKPVAPVSGSVSFDNNGSRFFGPYEGQVQAQAIILPLQRTTLTGLSPLPWDEMKYGSVKHELPLFAGSTLELYGSYTNAAPGYILKPEEIKSTSTAFGIAFDYNMIRQREENLSGKIAFETQDNISTILGAPLTHDYIRAFRFSLNYQITDHGGGHNTVNGTLSQGARILGASSPGQLYLSRADARPDFTKFNLDASRLQRLTDDWSLFAAASGQIASGPLYSAEQFGYGGQAFGRAYDSSAITGDEGIEASAEVRYGGIKSMYHFQPVPYGFYDTGAVWNEGTGATSYAAGSSAGAGFRLVTDIGFSSNFGVGFPLTHRIDNPISGNGKSPHYFISFAYGL